MAIARVITDRQGNLAFGCGLVSLAQVGPLGFRGEQRGRNGSVLVDIRTNELQRSMYNLYMRGRARGNDQEGGRTAYSTKAKLRMSKILLSRDRGQVGPGIRSLIVKGKAQGT